MSGSVCCASVDMVHSVCVLFFSSFHQWSGRSDGIRGCCWANAGGVIYVSQYVGAKLGVSDQQPLLLLLLLTVLLLLLLESSSTWAFTKWACSCWSCSAVPPKAVSYGNTGIKLRKCSFHKRWSSLWQYGHAAAMLLCAAALCKVSFTLATSEFVCLYANCGDGSRIHYYSYFYLCYFYSYFYCFLYYTWA